MKVTSERMPEAQMQLVVELPDDRVQRSLDQAARRLSNRLRIPGFRKGKAPRRVIEQMIGPDALYEEAQERMLPEALQEALDQETITPSAFPHIEVTRREPFTFTAIVPLPPDVQLGEYRTVAVAKPEPEVSEDEIEEQMLDLRRRHAVLEPVERPPQYNDRITADIRAEADGDVILEQEEAELTLREDSPLLAPGFTEQLLGLAIGEEHQIEVEVPDDWQDSRTAGKTLSVQLSISAVREEDLPPPDDDFAMEISDEYETYDALRQRVADDLREGAERAAAGEFQRAVLEAVISSASVEYPPALVEHELEHRRANFAAQMGQDPRTFLRGGSEQEDQLLASFRSQASEAVISQLVLDAVAGAEEIEITDEEVEGELEAALQGAPPERRIEVLGDESVRPNIRGQLRQRRTIERLEQIALANYLANPEAADKAADEAADGEADEAGEPSESDGDDED